MPPLINQPNGLFVTPNGEIFIAEPGNDRVRKILRCCNNRESTVTICGTGISGYNGDDQPATSAQLDHPISVFVSSRNEVYISEFYGNRIRKILSNGNIVTVVGTGVEGYNGDGILASSAMVHHPSGLFVTEDGDELYFADRENHRIRMVGRDGVIRTVAGIETNGYDGDGGLALNAQLCCPSGVCIYKSNMYICDNGSHRIRKVDSNGIISTIVGETRSGCGGDGGLATSARLNSPWDFTIFNDELYIADFYNQKVRKVLRDGTITTIAGTGEQGYNGDGQLATSSQLNHPAGVFVMCDGCVLIAESYGSRIRKINRNGIISTMAGDGTHGYSGDIPFDIKKYPHIGTRKIIQPFPKAYFDLVFK